MAASSTSVAEPSSLGVHALCQDATASWGALDLDALVLDGVDCLVMVLDEQASIIRFNRACQRATGFSAADVMGQSFTQELVAPEDGATVMDVHAHLLSGGHAQHLESGVRTANGGCKRVAWCMAGLADDAGNVTHVVCTGTDVTQACTGDDALQRALEDVCSPVGEELFRKLVGHVAATFHARWGLVGEVRGAQTIQTLVFQDAGRLLENPVRVIDLEGSACQSVIQQGRACCSTRARQLHPQDALLTGLDVEGWCGVALKDGSGNVLGVLMVMHDGPLEMNGSMEWFMRVLSARAAGELERRRQEQALRGSEARFRHLAENAQDLVYRLRLDPQPVYEFVSPSATRMVGFTPQELYADPSLHIKQVHPDDRWKLANLKHDAPPPDTPLILRWFRKDGSLIHMEHHVTVIHDEQGNTEAIEGIARDITARHLADRFREEYLSMISHDLRNPLSAMLTRATWLKRQLLQKGLEREAAGAESIMRSGAGLNAMIQDLVESARLESAHLVIRKEPRDLGALLTDAAERGVKPDERVRVRLDVQPGLPPVPVDAQRLERVVVNLLTNALKFSPLDRPVVVRLVQRDHGTGNEVVVAVTDQGMGIPAEDVGRLFQRFSRGSGAHRTEGLGLGLYISRLIVEAHGGRLWVESKPGHGSTFQFTLPL